MRHERRRGKARRTKPTASGPEAATAVPVVKAPSGDVSEHLLDPVVRQAVKIAASAKHPRSTTLKVNWMPDTVQRLAAWLRGGAEPAALAALLADDPLLIGHPLVYRQLVRLRWLRTVLDEADIELGFSTPRDYIPPPGIRLAADDALRALTEEWVRGVLGKNWSLKLPAKRRGRKQTLASLVKAFDPLAQYENVLEKLNQHSVRRAKGESEEVWTQRLAGVLRVVWRECFYSVEAGPQASDSGDPFDVALVYRVDPLPEERAEKWAKEAVELAAEGAIRDRLAYRMIGYHPNLTPDTVRGRIQAARKVATKS